jgi:hypothetical protein
MTWSNGGLAGSVYKMMNIPCQPGQDNAGQDTHEIPRRPTLENNQSRGKAVQTPGDDY